jgi:hypothetical protein
MHVEKMIVEAMMAGRIRLPTLRAVPKETQRREDSVYRRGTGDKSPLYSDGISRQRQSGCGNARRPICGGPVDYQSVGGIGLVQKVVE